MALLIWIDIAGKTSLFAWLLCCQKSSPNSGLIVGQTRDEPEWVLLQLGTLCGAESDPSMPRCCCCHDDAKRGSCLGSCFPLVLFTLWHLLNLGFCLCESHWLFFFLYCTFCWQVLIILGHFPSLFSVKCLQLSHCQFVSKLPVAVLWVC